MGLHPCAMGRPQPGTQGCWRKGRSVPRQTPVPSAGSCWPHRDPVPMGPGSAEGCRLQLLQGSCRAGAGGEPVLCFQGTWVHRRGNCKASLVCGAVDELLLSFCPADSLRDHLPITAVLRPFAREHLPGTTLIPAAWSWWVPLAGLEHSRSPSQDLHWSWAVPSQAEVLAAAPGRPLPQ